MKRQCLHKFILVLLSFCISLSFFISAFADAFTGAYLYTGVDPVTGLPIVEVRGVNPTGQTFSGSNVIEMNAYNNAPILTNNTFNGTTSIDPAFTDITSNGNTYNGTTTITYDGITGGQLESNNDTFATANVNTSNADVELNNPTFNGNTTLQAQNVSLGSISQMDTLNGKIDYLIANFLLFKELMFSTANTYNGNGVPAALSFTGTYNGVSVSQEAIYYSLNMFSFSNGTLSVNIGRYRSSYSGMLYRFLVWMYENVQQLFYYLVYNILWNSGSYSLYTFTNNGETYTLTKPNSTTYLRDAFINRIDTIISILDWYAHRFYEWYYPLDSTAPYYWRYYNTDTELQESIGLAGLWYNISWYLGEIYQNLTDAGSDMTSDAQQLGSSISALNTAEESVNTQIQSAFSTVSGIMTLPVISAAALCISWIEYMWGSLGIFQSPTLLAYMCVILMMLIGFAKYRSAFR